MPATKGNRNAMRHGVHGYLATGSLPKGASYIRRQLARFQKALEASVVEVSGEVRVYQAALISSAIRHEARAALLSRWLKREGDSLPLQDRIALLREISAATTSRDACIKAMGLDREPDPLAGIYDAAPYTPQDATAADDEQAAGSAGDDAAAGRSDDEAGDQQGGLEP